MITETNERAPAFAASQICEMIGRPRSWLIENTRNKSRRGRLFIPDVPLSGKGKTQLYSLNDAMVVLMLSELRRVGAQKVGYKKLLGARGRFPIGFKSFGNGPVSIVLNYDLIRRRVYEYFDRNNLVSLAANNRSITKEQTWT